jgi:RimJ/RimL family protein N-acetyltransferase
MANTFWAESRAASEQWLRRYADGLATNGYAPWTVVLRANRRIVGWGGLNVDPHAPGWGPEVSYFIHPAYAGQGFATELVRASLDVGFTDVKLPVISAFASPANGASIRVLEKCGFRLVGYAAALARNHYEVYRQDWIDTAR